MVIVDLPIPGAPPISTSDPGTSPPPSTRSNSPIPVAEPLHPRCLDLAERHRRERAAGRARERRLRRRAGAAARFSSAIVFHSPQPGQRPCHFGLSCPQELQAKTVAERGIPARLRAAVDGFAPGRVLHRG